MDLFKIGFITVRLLDLIDITVVAFLLYKAYMLLRGNAAVNIFVAVVLIYFLWLLCDKILHLQLLGSFLGQFISIGVLALIVVFQPEIRRFLIVIGANSFVAKSNLTKQFLSWKDDDSFHEVTDIKPIVKACFTLAKTKTGALIILSRKSDLKHYIGSGDMLNAMVSKRLIESIFSKNSPMHDGALIIEGNKIAAARCVLPATENPDLPARLGMRHRAALGISEQTDALAISVSEETGDISVAEDGELIRVNEPEQMEKLLSDLMQ